MRIRRLKVIIAVFFALALAGFASAQTVPVHEAELLLKDGKTIRSATVFLSADNGVLLISPKKARKIANVRIPFSEIKSADYTYSRRAQVAEGLATVGTYTLLCGCVNVFEVALFLPYAFTKIKTHWMVIGTEKNDFLLKLGRDDYRQLMLEMHKAGIRVVDSGKKPKKGDS